MYESLKEYFRTRGILLVIVIKARQTLRRHDHGWYIYKINFHWLSPLSIYTALPSCTDVRQSLPFHASDWEALLICPHL